MVEPCKWCPPLGCSKAISTTRLLARTTVLASVRTSCVARTRATSSIVLWCSVLQQELVVWHHVRQMLSTLIGIMRMQTIYLQTTRVPPHTVLTSVPLSKPKLSRVKHLRVGVSANQQKPICQNRQKRDWCDSWRINIKGVLSLSFAPRSNGVFFYSRY